MPMMITKLKMVKCNKPKVRTFMAESVRCTYVNKTPKTIADYGQSITYLASIFLLKFSLHHSKYIYKHQKHRYIAYCLYFTLYYAIFYISFFISSYLYFTILTYNQHTIVVYLWILKNSVTHSDLLIINIRFP